MLRSSVFAAITAAFGILASGPGLAQAPDGETPAEEMVCDQLKGGTPGLYGLCVAYCEAQDFEEMLQQAKAGGNPGGKILDRYRAKMTASDPDMPCIVSASTCPGFDIDVCTGDIVTLSCQIQIFNVANLFSGQFCDAQDSCQNSLGSTTDICRNSGETRSTAASVIPSGNDVALCSARTPDLVNGGFDINGVIVDLATAQVCLTEINTYDSTFPRLDVDDVGTLMMCGLGD